MFLLVYDRHVGAHLGEHQHGVSIEISTSLGETFLRISRIRYIPLPWILARVFVYVPLSFPRFWTLFTEWFWCLFWCILNGMTLKPAIVPTLFPSPPGHFCTWVLSFWYFCQLKCDRLINPYSERQKLKIDHDIQFSIFFYFTSL